MRPTNRSSNPASGSSKPTSKPSAKPAPKPKRGQKSPGDRESRKPFTLLPERGQKPSRHEKALRIATGVVFTLVLLLLLLAAQHKAAPPKDVSLSQAVSYIKDGAVEKATIDDLSNTLTLTLQDSNEVKTGDASAHSSATRKVAAHYPFAYSDTLTQLLLDNHVKTATQQVPHRSVLLSLITSFAPILLLLGVMIWLVRGGGLTGSIGKMSGKRGKELGEVPDTRFDDVAGADEAVTELRELVEFFNDAERFTRVGAKAPRGALLVGPPGTGKTLLARAVAGQAGVPFYPLAGSDFVETFVGVGARRVRDLWDRARKSEKGAIIFIDEIDAIGGKRGGPGQQMSGDSERENTLVSMLNELDGIEGGHRIILLAATNRPDVLDPALIRPGRLDRHIQVPAPDRRGREAVLKVHARNRPIDALVDFTLLARRTPGMSGAELEQIVNEACMEAGRRCMDTVTQDCFDAAVATVAMGRARTSALVTDHDRQVTAWHEAGHTLAALLQPAADDPVSVSIVPRGPAGGVTWMGGSDDMYLTRAKALAQLRTAMAGRAAEEILLDGEFTQGAHGDLTSASNLALAMVTKYGMAGPTYLLVEDDTLRMGGPVAMAAREAADKLLHEAHADVRALLDKRRDLLAEVADALLEHETLSRAQIFEIAARHVVAHELAPTT